MNNEVTDQRVLARSQSTLRIHRNLIIFAALTLGSGWLGALVNWATEAPDPARGLGTLLWLVIPMATGLLLRGLGGDGWRDAGLKPNLRSGWRWYVVASAIFPLLSILLFGLGPLVGAFSLDGFAARGLGTFVSLVGVAFASSFVKNIFEEFAWRGYLTPRFDALRLNPFINHLLTGMIWAGWHVPYCYSLSTFSSSRHLTRPPSLSWVCSP